MENNKNTFWIGLVVFAVVLVAVFLFYKKSGTDNNISPSPSVSGGVTPTNSTSPSSSPTSDIAPKCQLTGEIVFDGEVFVHTGSQEFNYQNVLDPHDIIKWQISPSTPLGTGPSGENFDIGPNRVSGLAPLKGSDYLTVSFNGTVPKYKKYELSASIDYVAVVDNAAKILNAKCSGKTTLTIK